MRSIVELLGHSPENMRTNPMTNLDRALAAAALAAGLATPALGQYYPPPTYPQTYPGYGNPNQYGNLWNGGFQILVDQASPDRLDVVTRFDGKTSSEVHFTFAPKDGGKATLVDADVTVDTAVMRKAFTGTPQERLANVPEFAFAQGMQAMMAKYAERIEAGTPVVRSSEGW